MSTRLDFDTVPSMSGVYVRALASRKSKFFDGEIPHIEANLKSITFNPKEIADYAALCGFAELDRVPWTYPQVIAAPLHGQIMAHKNFPLPLMGLIHVRQSITSHRAIATDETLSMMTCVEGHHEAKRGVEFDLVTRFSAGDEPVWEGRTTVLHRRTGSGKPSTPPPVEYGDAPGTIVSSVVRVPEDMGRRYSAIGRDYNPIHLYATTAKAFGFKRAIIHGMWTLARALAEVEHEAGETGTLDAKFVRPVFLPSSIVISALKTKQGLDLGVRSADGRTTHLLGSVTK